MDRYRELIKENIDFAERNYQTTVTAEEAPLLARLMQANEIGAAQFNHENLPGLAVRIDGPAGTWS